MLSLWRDPHSDMISKLVHFFLIPVALRIALMLESRLLYVHELGDRLRVVVLDVLQLIDWLRLGRRRLQRQR